MPSNTPPPNIVFVHVDQMRHDAISAYGNSYVHTPNIDRILADGTSFHYSYSGNPVCCPARTCWYTGRASSEHGVVQNQLPLLESVPDLGQWMGERGYRCFYTGKWHIPNRRVDKSFTLLPGGDGHGERGDAGVASAAAGFIKNYKGNKPFFLNVGFLNPHDCCYLTFASENPATKFGLIDRLRDQLPPLPGSCDLSAGPFLSGEGGEFDADRVRFYAYCYYRMVEMVDAEIGRVYDALRASDHADNTLFILTSDHGEMLGHHNQFKKGVLYDSAMRVPLVCVLPGRVRANFLDREHLVVGMDIPATILDYAGLEPMPNMRASSLRPLLEGQTAPWREYAVTESTSQGAVIRAVSTKEYKAVFAPGAAPRLHDMQTDPLEMHNLADAPDHAELLAKARAQHNAYVDTLELHPDYAKFGKI